MTQSPQYQELHRVTSTAIIYTDEGKYLILKRSPQKKAFPGMWTVPGGGLEVEDYLNTEKTTGDLWYFSLEESLRREIREECGLEVGDLNYLCDITFIRPDRIPVIILSFYAPYVSGEVRLDEDSVDSAWVTFKEAREYELIDGILEEIKVVDERIY